MSMSRKHYTEVAAIIDIARNNAGPDDTAQAAVAEIAENLASMFRRDNAGFSYTRFYEACGIPAPARHVGAR